MKMKNVLSCKVNESDSHRNIEWLLPRPKGQILEMLFMYLGYRKDV